MGIFAYLLSNSGNKPSVSAYSVQDDGNFTDINSRVDLSEGEMGSCNICYASGKIFACRRLYSGSAIIVIEVRASQPLGFMKRVSGTDLSSDFDGLNTESSSAIEVDGGALIFLNDYHAANIHSLLYNSATNAIEPHAVASVQGDETIGNMRVDVSGNLKVLYADLNSYEITGLGGLAFLDRAPTNDKPSDVAVDPLHRFLYAITSQGDPLTGRLRGYRIAGGKFTPIEGLEDFVAGSRTPRLVMSPDGKYLIVAAARFGSGFDRYGINTLFTYAVNSTTGALVLQSELAYSPGQYNNNSEISRIAFSPDGRYLYVGFNYSGDESSMLCFDVSIEGQLTKKTSSKTIYNSQFLIVDL
ncbi:hypothetical protein [Brucella pituitosa]|uniref:hypothetical protein n=1 Tax=Brucella pituitosa TaxID=571256 RepID=UPI001260316E|nr:hypothetical protein [Brucella pituitosa]